MIPRVPTSRTSPAWVSRSYTVHLITVGLAGILLFVALVGAVAITNPRRPERPDRGPIRGSGRFLNPCFSNTR